MAYFKTHYYGGIRKYQWVTIPMELHGQVAMKDGSSVMVNKMCIRDRVRADRFSAGIQPGVRRGGSAALGTSGG